MRSLILFAKYNKNDQVKEDEIGRACSMDGVLIAHWWESQKETDH
jgi:hypothetical protein